MSRVPLRDKEQPKHFPLLLGFRRVQPGVRRFSMQTKCMCHCDGLTEIEPCLVLAVEVSVRREQEERGQQRLDAGILCRVALSPRRDGFHQQIFPGEVGAAFIPLVGPIQSELYMGRGTQRRHERIPLRGELFRLLAVPEHLIRPDHRHDRIEVLEIHMDVREEH